MSGLFSSRLLPGSVFITAEPVPWLLIQQLKLLASSHPE